MTQKSTGLLKHLEMLKFYRRISILSQTDLNFGYLSSTL